MSNSGVASPRSSTTSSENDKLLLSPRSYEGTNTNNNNNNNNNKTSNTNNIDNKSNNNTESVVIKKRNKSLKSTKTTIDHRGLVLVSFDEDGTIRYYRVRLFLSVQAMRRSGSTKNLRWRY